MQGKRKKMSNPRENYIHYLFGQSASSVTHFGIKMGTPLPDFVMRDMVLNAVDALLKTTGKPPLTKEEIGCYEKIMSWLHQDSEKLKPVVDKILMEQMKKRNSN